MNEDWEIRRSGPTDADHTVLLVPGGLNTSRSYAELMAEPSLAGVGLVAVTLPGHGGTPSPDDFSIENYARLTANVASSLGCDAVVGFSVGATAMPNDEPGRVAEILIEAIGRADRVGDRGPTVPST